MLSNLKISKASIFLGAFLFIAQFISGFHVVLVHGTSAIFNAWYFLAFYWAIGWWFINDSRKHELKWFDAYMDTGMFLYLAWIFIIPYYLFKTRGRKAFYIIGVLTGIYFGAYLAGVLFYLLTKAI